jgi:hypothetical protein
MGDVDLWIIHEVKKLPVDLDGRWNIQLCCPNMTGFVEIP